MFTFYDQWLFLVGLKFNLYVPSVPKNGIYANNVDQDQTPQNAASDLSLYFLTIWNC